MDVLFPLELDRVIYIDSDENVIPDGPLSDITIRYL
jgi:hypothetical protein